METMNRKQRRAHAAQRRKTKGLYLEREIDVRRVSSALIKSLIAADQGEKQFWIEAAFRLLCTDDYVDQAKDHFKWKDGVQPDIAPDGEPAEAPQAQGGE